MDAPGEDRTHGLQIARVCDYETDALPTALPRHMVDGGKVNLSNSVTDWPAIAERAVQSSLRPMQVVCLKGFHLTYF